MFVKENPDRKKKNKNKKKKTNKQKFLVAFFRIDCNQYVKPKIFQKMFVVLEMELQNLWAPTKSVAV